MTENLTRVTVTCLVAIFVAAVLATAYVNQGSTTGPDMTPTYGGYRAQAEEVCDGAVVRTGPEIASSRVVVVRNDSSVVIMTTAAARDLLQRDVPLWPIAVCRADIVP